ncbi:hypothetical protein MAIT1_03130 [Magnetofaba australis IT-1]|uniref:Cytidylate kinase n=2 Tax=Magnetofaba TaxID=1472292 RepID=A0A1Y2K5N0_9PROT|nr:hypothetical protein MAIT1_03130 [Magnetofaba australis IT-1]
MGVEIYTAKKQQKMGPGAPLVTISRTFGAGGTDIARLLAQRLEVPFYDREILEGVAEMAKGDKYLLEKLDERAPKAVENFIYSLVPSKGTSKDKFNYYLIKTILGIASRGDGGVIIGRGAHLILRDRPVFRLRVEGSKTRCVERLSLRFDIKKADAEAMFEKVNAERNEFVRNLYKAHVTDHHFYDMTINSDVFAPEQVVKLATRAMDEMGFEIPKKKRKG